MSRKDTSTLQELQLELEENSEYRQEYRKQKPYYDLVLEIIGARKRLGLTQQQLADRVGTHQSNISRIESGEHDLRLSTLVAIAEALEARVQIWLLSKGAESGYRTEKKPLAQLAETKEQSD